MHPNTDNDHLKKMKKVVSEMNVYFDDDDYNQLLYEFREFGHFAKCTQSTRFHQKVRDLVARHIQKLYCLFNHFMKIKKDDWARRINREAQVVLSYLMDLLVLTHNHNPTELEEAKKIDFEHNLGWLIINTMISHQSVIYNGRVDYYDEYIRFFDRMWNVWVNNYDHSFPLLENLNQQRIIKEWMEHDCISELGKDSLVTSTIRNIMYNLAETTLCFVEKMKSTRNGERDRSKLMEELDQAMHAMIFILRETGNTNPTEQMIIYDKDWKSWMLGSYLIWRGNDHEFDVWRMVEHYSWMTHTRSR